MSWDEVPIPAAAIAKQGINLTAEEALSLVQFREDIKRVEWQKELGLMTATEAAVCQSILKLVEHAVTNHNAQMAAQEDKTYHVQL